MTPLGRGLASLIPGLNKEKAKEVLARIDSMEFEDEMTEVEVKEEVAEVKPRSKKKVSVVEELEDVATEEIARPAKPLVTPLAFDEEDEEVMAEEAVTETEPEVAEEVAPEAEVEVTPEIAEEEQEIQTPEEEEAAEEQKEQESFEIEEEKEEETPAEEEIPVTEEEVEEAAPEVEAVAEVVAAAEGEDKPKGSIWDQHESQVQHIPIGDIHINPLQPRRSFDPHELEELTRSIEQHGILQPLVVHRQDDGYELIAGERRLRAAKSLGWDKVPAVVRRDVNTNQSRLVFALIENIQRENLNPIEEAMAYQQLNLEFGLTHEEIGTRVGRSRVGITNIVRVLQLPIEIQRGLSEGKISMGHARAILMIPDPEKQLRFYQHLLDEGLTVRKAETRARRIQRSMNINDPVRNKNRGRHTLAIQYTPKLEAKFGHDAYIKFAPEKNRFEITFRAYNEGEVHDLVGKLLGIVKDNLETDEDVREEE